MLLEHKTAIVYGAGGPVGAAVAGAFAREGARVALVGRTQQRLDKVAEVIRDAGGTARTAVVDVTDTAAMRAHADEVATANEVSGGIDIAFNAISNDDLQGIPLLGMDLADFVRPVSKVVATHFTIATVTAPHMRGRGGVILAMGGGREAIPLLGGSHVAWSALAGLCRQLAAELGPSGIRVAWLLSPGSPDPGDEDTSTGDSDPLAGGTLLGRRPSYADVANAAVFAASDWAATMTATEINLTGGAVID
jgi:3-oxoacyl-[acyl-carrier protein] reductase